MKQSLFGRLFFCAAILMSFTAGAGNLWQQVDANNAPKNLQIMHPKSFLVYTVDEATLKLQMILLSNDPAAGMVITLPMADGTARDFNVWQTPMMPDQLAARYPDIKTFTAQALDDRNVTAKIDFTLYGFHAMIYDGDQTSFIDPYDNYHDGFYMVHYRKDETRTMASRMKCLVHTMDKSGPGTERSMQLEQKQTHSSAAKTINGYQLRTYRLALACDDQYAAASTGLSAPTKAQAFSKMTTSMNRINGVYEREFSVTMTFVPNEDTIIFVAAAGDPYGPVNDLPDNLLDTNQKYCDARIGNANYDIGHVFTTGGGGLSDEGIVCTTGYKAMSETGGSDPVGDGFDIDYVAHEMGHEYGADHPFNDGVDGSCGGGNINPPTAYEPGSGSTIMAYAGICSPDDLQPHSDAYFHAISLEQIQQYITTGGDGCAVKTPTNNKLVSYSAFAATYSIPYLTAFELYAPVVTDSVADTSITYCWEEWDLGDAGETFAATTDAGPVFRSYTPVKTNLRVFPTARMVLDDSLSNAGIEDDQGEKVPSVARTLNFICTFRDVINNLGCFTIPDDEITLNAINTGAGFAVTSQAATGISYAGNSTHTITWNVVGTNTAPISAANVDIYMSVDSGYSWQYHVGTFPNNGTASVTVPNPAVTTAKGRFKVKGSGNVFFSVNSKLFTVTYNSSVPVTPSGMQQVTQSGNDVKIFPVPANNMVYVTSTAAMQAEVYNAIGQQVWKGSLNAQLDIPVALWAKGIYYMELTGANNARVVKRFIVD